jgi:hypothetical protein
MPKNVVPQVQNPLTVDVFFEDKCLARNNGARKMITFTPLAADEMPGQGKYIVASLIQPHEVQISSKWLINELNNSVCV